MNGYFERVTEGSDTTDQHFIRAGSKVVAIHNRQSDYQHTLRYLHRDHLGSIDVVTDETGTAVARMSFDAFGQRRQSIDWNDGFPTSTELNAFRQATTRGYTGHQMLDAVNLIHMNGRIYDPEIGRFLSPDPNVPSPHNAQSYNRYSYMYNNPLSFSDPSGFVPYQEWSPVMTRGAYPTSGGYQAGMSSSAAGREMSTMMAHAMVGMMNVVTTASIAKATGTTVSGSAQARGSRGAESFGNDSSAWTSEQIKAIEDQLEIEANEASLEAAALERQTSGSTGDMYNAFGRDASSAVIARNLRKVAEALRSLSVSDIAKLDDIQAARLAALGGNLSWKPGDRVSYASFDKSTNKIFLSKTAMNHLVSGSSAGKWTMFHEVSHSIGWSHSAYDDDIKAGSSGLDMARAAASGLGPSWWLGQTYENPYNYELYFEYRGLTP